MKKKILLIVFILFGNSLYSQQNSAEIIQALKKLNVTGSVLYIAAHPDDENTRLLAYLSKEKKVRTGYLSLTRGDGGQNLIGKEQAELLGLIRTQELLAARRIDGAEQFFTRANDFGFSKNPEETFKFWNKDSILSDVVWVIRNFKPDIIICRFPTTGEGGHGHHTASAILAEEAFSAAADPKKFPEQLKYTEIWQAKSLFWNLFNFGNTNPGVLSPIKIDVGVFNPLIGKTYGELAAESRTMHKSQGFGSAKVRGGITEYFRQLRGDSSKHDVFADVNITWSRINGNTIQKMIEDCIKYFDAQSPEKSLTQLLGIYTVINNLSESDKYVLYWKKQKLKELQSIIANCSGLWMEASSANYIGIPGKQIEFNAQLVCMNNANVKLNKITWPSGIDTVTSMTVKRNELVNLKHFEKLSPEIKYSNPYWLNKEHEEGLYHVNDQLIIGTPENESATFVVYHLTIEGIDFDFKRPLVYKSVDPVKGEIYRPFEIIPTATVNFSGKSFVFKNGAPSKIQLEINSNSDSINCKVKLQVPAGWKATPDNFDFNMMIKGEKQFFETVITPPDKNSTGFISAVVVTGNDSISKSIQRIEYDHIPYQFILTNAKSKVVSFDLEPGVKRIGYIPGAGDDVVASLKQVGYNVTELTETMIANLDLHLFFDAIVTGIRAYNTNEWMSDEYGKLMEFVKNGGNLIVQYNTNNRIGPVVAKISPYPFTISRDRVTDENAEVRFVNPQHSVLNYPNKISAEDFKGWRQERGIYFASEKDSSYQTVLSMNDEGEKASEGSLIIAKYGQGNFVYTGIVFFRELPAGVPGAYRLFANLLNIPKNN